MAKKKFSLDLNLFALICAGIAVACIVFFFACPFYEETSYTFLQNAIGVTKGKLTVLKADPIVWVLLVLPIAIAAVSLLVNNKIKWIINIALAVVAIVLLFVIPTIKLDDLNQIIGVAGKKVTCFDVIGPWVWIKAVCYAGIAGVSIFKLVK